ncbi:hypothetical protein NHQ30_008321 [Ciborinia camelliae]|nr:hypothetical protein NHQ30_008321 [Ciborinia camelliae]
MKDPQAEMVKINVFGGTDENEHLEGSFHVHKALICYYSTYFNSEFNNPGFIENQTQWSDFRFTSKKAFGIFVDWIYTRELRETSFGDLDRGQIDLGGHAKIEECNRCYMAIMQFLINL